MNGDLYVREVSERLRENREKDKVGTIVCAVSSAPFKKEDE